MTCYAVGKFQCLENGARTCGLTNPHCTQRTAVSLHLKVLTRTKQSRKLVSENAFGNQEKYEWANYSTAFATVPDASLSISESDGNLTASHVDNSRSVKVCLHL